MQFEVSGVLSGRTGRLGSEVWPEKFDGHTFQLFCSSEIEDHKDDSRAVTAAEVSGKCWVSVRTPSRT